MKEKKQASILLIYGGQGQESEVSIKGKEHILPLIDRDTYRLHTVFIDKTGRWLLENKEIFLCRGGIFCLDGGEKIAIDAAIPLLHGDFGEDGIIQGALDCATIPYVGCDVSASAVCRDKSFVKIIAERLGVPTLPHLSVLASEGLSYAVRRTECEFAYPVFVKPARLGSSVGAREASDRQELLSALQNAFSVCSKVIIEPYLAEKRELECGYFSTFCKELFTNPGEILHSGVYSYEDKYHSDSVGLAIRADIPEGVSEEIKEYSRRLVRALSIRDISRLDFFLCGEKIYFNEINTLPGFTDGSLYAKMVEAGGIPEAELWRRLIENALRRA